MLTSWKMSTFAHKSKELSCGYFIASPIAVYLWKTCILSCFPLKVKWWSKFLRAKEIKASNTFNSPLCRLWCVHHPSSTCSIEVYISMLNFILITFSHFLIFTFSWFLIIFIIQILFHGKEDNCIINIPLPQTCSTVVTFGLRSIPPHSISPFHLSHSLSVSVCCLFRKKFI